MTSRIEFIQQLYQYCEGYIEARCLPSRQQHFYQWSHDLNHLDRDLSRAGENAYFGVATRDGKGGGKENIVNIPALWCDIDFKDTPKDEAVNLIREFPFKPSIGVMSGGGYHLYWILDEPAEKDDIDKVEEVNRRIAKALKGDMAACDAARVMRVPDSLNHKYDPPRECKVLKSNNFECNLEDFEILPQAPLPAMTTYNRRTDKEQLKRAFSCRFMRHCYRDRISLPEPEWYAMVSNLARLSPGGISLVHLLSKQHPSYRPNQTNAKILHALDAAGPHSCQRIRSIGFDGCGDCGGRTPIGYILRHNNVYTRRDRTCAQRG